MRCVGLLGRGCNMCRMTDKEVLRLEQRDGEWVLAGEHAARFGLVDEYLAHLLDRNYSPATVRSYGYDLLAFCRWLTGVCGVRSPRLPCAAMARDEFLCIPASFVSPHDC